MKSQRRHELQENVLSTEIYEVVRFFKERGTVILIGLLVIGLIAVIAAYVYGSARDRQLKLQSNFEKAMTASVAPDEKVGLLESLAAQSDNKRIASEANVALGDEYSGRVTVMDRSSDPARWQELLETSKSYYDKVLAQYPDMPLAQAEARYGLAKLAEDQGDLAAAKEQYEAIVAMEQLKGFPIIQQAQNGLDSLDWLAQPVRMATTAPATQPASEPASAPASAPAEMPAEAPVETAPAE